MANNNGTIGALQDGSGNTPGDIGALQAAAAAPVEGGQIIMIMMSKLFIPFMWLKQDACNRRHFIRNTLASILGW